MLLGPSFWGTEEEAAVGPMVRDGMGMGLLGATSGEATLPALTEAALDAALNKVPWFGLASSRERANGDLLLWVRDICCGEETMLG
mmetsp:Transcript_14809/g.34174  ORF Transcript_14809/g.34174 Transcript_14809/m.34174 type:complete len:86 (-) Transcript_14809:75-332(-)